MYQIFNLPRVENIIPSEDNRREKMSEGSEIGPERPHLVANDVDLVLHLRNPLTHNGKQLWDGGARIHQDLQTGGVIGVKEGKGCRGNTMGKVSSSIQ